MKSLNKTELTQIHGGLAYTGGDYAEYLRIMAEHPYALSIK